MDVKYLEYVLETAKQKSITRAAEVLYISQSALSQYIQRLEQDVGAPLFVRNRGEMTLTAAGELYIEAAQSVISIREQLYANIAALRDAGRIRLGVSSAWGIGVVADILPELRRLCPGVRVQITQNKHRRLVQQLGDGELDIILTAANTVAGFKENYRLLRMEQLVLATPAAHHYNLSHAACGHVMTDAEFVEAFGKEPFVCAEEGSTMRAAEQAYFDRVKIHPKVVCEVNDNLAALQMVEGGVGVAFVPADYVKGRGVVAWQPNPPLQRFDITAWRGDLEIGKAEKALMGLIEGHRLFK